MIAAKAACLAALALLALPPIAAAHGLPGAPLELPPRDAWPSAGDAPPSSPLRLPTLSAPASRSAGGASEPFGVRFTCPFKTGAGGDLQAQTDDSFCPQYAIDAEDLLGQPQLVVDPANPDILAFHALHGGRGAHAPEPLGHSPPTPRSRHNNLHQPHTTFQSANGGGDWIDQRYFANDALGGPDRALFGEDNAIALDEQGRATIAALYSFRDPGDPAWSWAVTVYKTARLNRPVSYYENYMILHHDEADREAWRNRITDLHAVHAPGADRAAVVWLEHPTNETGAPNGDPSWVEVHWSTPGEGAQWEPSAPDGRVVGCRAITNPLAVGAEVYLGCLPGDGYGGDANASVDRWQIHALDAATGGARRVASTPITTEHALLVGMDDSGHMIVVGSGVEAGRPTVQISQGSLGRNWQPADEYGGKLSLLGPDAGVRLADARITAAAYTRQHSYLHLLYQEHYDASVADVERLTERQDVRSFDKTYAVIRPSAHRFEGRFDELRYGEPSAMAIDPGPVYRGADDSIFGDLHDSIVVWRDPSSGEERIFTAFGDYGTVRFAEVEEVNALPGILLPPVNVPAIPLLAGSTAPSSTGAIVGAITGLMLLRLLTARKKTIAKAPTL